MHGPDYRHVRAFVLLPDLSGLAVVDRFLTGDRPLSAEAYLHLDAAALVALDTSRRVIALCVAGGLLVAASSAGLSRLRQAIEDATFQGSPGA